VSCHWATKGRRPSRCARRMA